jgi:hypothetical protein
MWILFLDETGPMVMVSCYIIKTNWICGFCSSENLNCGLVG